MKTLFMIFGLVAMLALFFVHENTKLSMPSQDAFENWCLRYNKVYATHELKEYRRLIYYVNKNYIDQENARQNDYVLGENHLMDLTSEEFKSIFLTYKPSPMEEAEYEPVIDGSDIDWVAKGKVSEVKDQGQCGSCWAFSTTGSIESAYMIFKNQSPLLSEQQLVDCDKVIDMGCNGGNVAITYRWIEQNKITTEDKYPYKAKDQKCKFTGGDYTMKKGTNIPSKDCNELQKALQQQPISIAVDAQKWSWYKGGIFSNCGTSLDHAVLLVGWKDGEYWKVKNSWGTSWGEDGYIRLAPGNTCGLCNQACYPSL